MPVWLRHNPFGLGGGLAFGQGVPFRREGGGRSRHRRRGSREGVFFPGGFGGLGGSLRGLNPQALALAASDRDFGADDYEALLVGSVYPP